MSEDPKDPLRQLPSHLAKAENITQTTALPTEEDAQLECHICGASHSPAHNPLAAVAGFLYADGSEEYVHIACARGCSRYGSCWCCEANHESKVFMSEAINGAGECEDHAGESQPDYPIADRDSYLEYMREHK